MFQHIYLARPRDGERGVFNLAYFHLGLAFYAIVSVFTCLFFIPVVFVSFVRYDVSVLLLAWTSFSIEETQRRDFFLSLARVCVSSHFF